MERPNWNNKHSLYKTRIEAIMHGSQEDIKTEYAELKRPSRMIEIDHLMEQREEDLLMDKYYYMEV